MQKSIRWADFCLVAMDEIHHCEKEHPFRRLIVKNHSELQPQQRPKIFSMTASPAADMCIESCMSRLRNLLRTLGDAKICQVDNCILELNEHKSNTSLQFVYVQLSESELSLQRSLQEHLLACYRYLVKHTNIVTLDLKLNIDPYRADVHNRLEFDGEKLVQLRSSLELVVVRSGDSFAVRSVLDHVFVVSSALMGLTMCGEIAAYNVLSDVADDSPKSFAGLARYGVGNQALARTVRDNCRNRNVADYVQDAIRDGHSFSAYDKLMGIILNEVDWNARAENYQPLVLILVRERKTAGLLCEILKSNAELQRQKIKVASLVGHGSGGASVKGYNDGMSVAKQSRILGELRDHFYQIIVATSVAEEGLDLPSCDLVVEMDPPGSITSLVQIRGRARRKQSRLFSICRSDWQETYILRLVRNEQYMYRAIDSICREQEQDDLEGGD